MAQADKKTRSTARTGRRLAAGRTVKAKKAAAKPAAPGGAAKSAARKKTAVGKSRAKKGGKRHGRKVAEKHELAADCASSNTCETGAIQKANQQDEGELTLDARLTIKNIAALIQALETSPKTIDAGAVEQVDTAALQVLVAYANSARAAQRDVHWCKGAGKLPQALEQAGLKHIISFTCTSAAELMDDGLCPVF